MAFESHNPTYLPRPLPPALQGLAELALDVRWNWNHSADTLWEYADQELWHATGNAWLILESVSHRRLEELATDARFLRDLQGQLDARSEYLGRATWFDNQHGAERLGPVAYFSMEFGLGEALPIYSGGLGILAGDHLKTASDLGVPLVGVGLLYDRGYFRQALDAEGRQLAFYPYNDPTLIPALPLRDSDGEWLRISLEMPGRTLHLRGWQVQVGRVRLYLLDSNHPLNLPRDRGITSELYGGDPETRLEQEIVLGIGGWRLLATLGIGCGVCHLNEGHAAFVVLERARWLMQETGLPFAVALRCTCAGNLFTTHTPIDAAFDRFPTGLIRQYFSDYAFGLGLEVQELLALGQNRNSDDDSFNMAYLAARGATHINGVSRLHGEVSRRIFQPLFPRRPLHEVPIGHLTNGVHMPSWDSAHADQLWTNTCGKNRWLGDLGNLEEQFRALSDEALWNFRSRARNEMLQHLRLRLVRQQRSRGERPERHRHPPDQLDANVLTLGFARRFAEYKRPDLLLHDQTRLVRLITDPQWPVQLIVAGKAHPRDAVGQRLVRQWADFMRRPEVRGRVFFVEDYDIGLAAELVQGVDLWLNTPRRPWEASGTSGMKVLVNGGLNLSELDGWWAEAYTPDVGWALGDGQEHDSDPAWDAAEAQQLYALLEQEVIPAFYQRDEKGIPLAWVQRIRESMAYLTPRFSANRMVREYTERFYLPAAAACQRRMANNGELGRQLEAWREAVSVNWPRLRFGNLTCDEDPLGYRFTLQVYLEGLPADHVRVELYAEPKNGEPALWPMQQGPALAGALNGYIYVATVPADRPASDYTPRIVPYHPEASIPLEARQILWHH